MTTDTMRTARGLIPVLFVALACCLTPVLGAGLAGAAGATAHHDGDSTQPHPSQPSRADDSTANETELYVTLEGRGIVTDQYDIVTDHPGERYVWESESLTLQLTVKVGSDNPYHACGLIRNATGERIRTIDCVTDNTSGQYIMLRLRLDEWPSGAEGRRILELELLEQTRTASSGTDPTRQDGNTTTTNVTRATRRFEVLVMSKEGDMDGDGLSNAREVEIGTDFTRADTAGNGLTDWEEVHVYGTNPLETDTTGDGVSDGTIAHFGLPPTVPYILHIAVVAGILTVTAVGVAALKLRAWLRSIKQVKETTTQPPPAGPAPGTDTDTQLSPKKEEILTILHHHGGQMPQTDLVDESDWSKATVSRILSSLEDEDHVEKVQIGRGNVVKLIDTPFDTQGRNVSG